MSDNQLNNDYAITNKLNVPGFSVTNRAEPSGSSDLSEFKDLLTLMMVGLGGSLGGSTGDGFSSMGMDMSGLMAPLMLGLLEKLLSQQVKSGQGQDSSASQSLAASTEGVQNSPEGIPGSGKVPYGMPIKGYLTQASRSGHTALDFGAPVGTPVKATMNGTVVYAGWNNEGYGNLVIIDNGKYRTYYAHLSKIPVKVGQKVSAGETIALSGNTGNSTGPHLHYEVRVDGRQVDPAKYIGKKL